MLPDDPVFEPGLTFGGSEIASFHPDFIVSQPFDGPGYQGPRRLAS